MQADINKNTRLFLDDLRIPTESGYAVVRSYDDAVHFMRTRGCPDFISFDHDLQTLTTGYDVAKWIVDRDMDSRGDFIPNNFSFYVHSMNPVGKKNIEMLLNNYLKFKSLN